MIQSRFVEGDRIGRFTVILVLGRRTIRKGKAKMWMYRLRCGCGRVEELAQERLIGGKTQRTDCKACMNKRSRTHRYGEMMMPHELPYGVPNFAILPAPRCITSRPECY